VLYGAQLRSGYPDAVGCVCTAEGRPVDPSALSVRSMNFGQHWRTEGIVDVECSVEMPRAWLVDFATREWASIVEDAQRFPEDDTALDAALRARGWPAPDVAIAEDEVARHAAEWLAYDLLEAWLGAVETSAGERWVINRIVDVRIRSDVVHVAASGRRDDRPVMFQDL
jgi:hypothetical protein